LSTVLRANTTIRISAIVSLSRVSRPPLFGVVELADEDVFRLYAEAVADERRVV
jgi:hypothetical protein